MNTKRSHSILTIISSFYLKLLDLYRERERKWEEICSSMRLALDNNSLIREAVQGDT